MFGQIPFDIILLFMLYAAGATTAVIACIYLLFRKGNAFAPDVVTPLRLRRWTAAFFGILALGHFWYLPAVVFTSKEDINLILLIGALLDCVTTIPLAIIIQICMLQDRRRPLWPVWVAVAPLAIILLVSNLNHSYTLVPELYGYLLLLGIGLIVYMVRAVRQYGRWLRDNYADLEHKEIWQSLLVLGVILLVFGFYASGVGGQAYEYIVQVCGIVLICFLLWRVETLSDLSISQSLPESDEVKAAETATTEEKTSTAADSDDIGALLQHFCVSTRLYLQHDLTVTQLAQAIGTNRFYLGQYFSRQDTTYNAYINTLRINHFVKLYHEAVTAQRSFTAQQLANDSGYRSYSTFSLAFKQRMGQSVTSWMRQQEV